MVRRGAAVAWALALPVLAGGCGFMSASAHPTAASSTDSGPATATSATASSSPPPGTVVTAELAGSFDGRPASLRVAVAAAQKGSPPHLARGDCRLTSDATEYAEISVLFINRSLPTKKTGVSSNLRLDLSVTGARDVGVMVVSSGPTTYCNNTSVMPSTDTLQTQNLAGEHQTVAVYVVARTTAAHPNPLRGVTVKLRNPRHHPDDIDPRVWTWNVGQKTGSACPADITELCVPIG